MLIKEEKLKTSSKLIKSFPSKTTHQNNKENKPNELLPHKFSPKNIKRIGTKPIIKAFQAFIEVIPEEQFYQTISKIKEKDVSFSERCGFSSVHESGYRKLKRVGKKNGVASYQETIAEDESEKKYFNSSQQGNLEHTIIINEPQEIQETQIKYTNTAMTGSIAGSTKWRKESIQIDDTIDILNSVYESSCSLFQQVISEEGELSKKKFSIKVNKAELVDKSDICIQNSSFIKTESDLIRNSNSFSLPNEIETCVGESKLSFIQTDSNDHDSKIEQLIEEIESNCHKNRGSNQSKKSSFNYLQVPNTSSRNSLNRFSSLNKPVEQDRILGSSSGSSLDSKTEKAKSEDENDLHKSSILSDLSEEEKILESLEEKSKKKKLEQFSNEPLKISELANENIRKSEGYKTDHSKIERTLSKIEEVIENEKFSLGTSNVIISKEKLKTNFETSLNISKKNINGDNDLKRSETIRIKKMTHSTHIKESREPSAKRVSNNTQLNEVQVKNNQISGSIHNPMNPRTPLKNNKIEQTSSNNPKIRLLKQNEVKSKDQKTLRRNSRKFEVNKLVTEARKVTKEKHIL